MGHRPIKGVSMRFAIATRRRDPDQLGQGLAEYALILSLIAIVVIVALQVLGTDITNLLNSVGASV
jgi:pilus assembly protein Flp/PilA